MKEKEMVEEFIGSFRPEKPKKCNMCERFPNRVYPNGLCHTCHYKEYYRVNYAVPEYCVRTQQEIANELGITQQGVNHIEKRGFGKIRFRPGSKRLLNDLMGRSDADDIFENAYSQTRFSRSLRYRYWRYNT